MLSVVYDFLFREMNTSKTPHAQVIRSDERGFSRLSWLESRFSYSFAGYFNPLRMCFGDLRVINDDIIQPDKGFGTHFHDNMEIISIPTHGGLAHKDSLGSEGVVGVGEVQVMSAGTGVEHSEFNASSTEPGQFFQIWILPKEQGIAPRYDQRRFDFPDNELVLVVSGEEDEALTIHQDAKIWWGRFQKGFSFEQALPAGKGLMVMVVEGQAKVAGEILARRDAIELAFQSSPVDVELLEASTLMMIEVNLH